MTKRPRWWLIGSGIVVAALIAVAIDLARFAGVFTAFHPGFSGTCTVVPTPEGSSEDIQVDRELGIAYLSIRDRATDLGKNEVQGTIKSLALGSPEPAPQPALRAQELDIRPHGMSLFQRGTDPARLFVISLHGEGPHSVFVLRRADDGYFDVEGEPIQDQTFVNPNAIAAVGPRQFYVANNSSQSKKSARQREMLFRSAKSQVIYYDGNEARVAAEGLAGPSGIALSPDTQWLYLSETLAKALRVYKRDLATGELTPEETIPLGALPDNLNVDADGVVWIGAHPKMIAFLMNMGDVKKPAPTLILKFDPRKPKPADGERDTRLSQVYANAGEQISAGSVAAAWRNEFLIGAVVDPKVLICKPIP